MTIVHALKADRIVVGIKGDLDLKTSTPLREALEQLIMRYPDRHLLLDLSEVEFVDSSGLGVILGRYRRLQETGRTLSLVGVRSSVRAVLELAGIDSIISVTDAVRGEAATTK